MAYDTYAMYQVHYLSEQNKGHAAYKRHSLHTITNFLLKDLLLVLHHMALLTIFMPVALVSIWGIPTGGFLFISFFLVFKAILTFLSALVP